MTEKTKKIIAVAWTIAVAIGFALVMGRCLIDDARSFQGSSSSGGGIGRVTTNSPGLLAGSGTTGSPLTATLTVGGIISGTGSSGSALIATEVGDIAGVTAGSGLINGGTTGTVTLDVAVGTGLSVAADAVNLNLTGATCTNGQGMTVLGSTGTGTCGNVGYNSYAGTHFEWSEEFLFGAVVNTVALGPYHTNFTGTGTSSCDGTIGTTTRPGICNSTTGSTGTGRASITTALTQIDFASYTTASFEWAGGVPTLSTSGEEYTLLVGFSATLSASPTDGCFFLYDRGNVSTGGVNTGNADKWECFCANNSTRTGSVFLMDGSTVSANSFTTVNQPVAALTLPSTNLHRLKVLVTGTTKAEFFVDDVKSCEVAANIPSGARRVGAMFSMLKSNGNTARTTNTDWVRLALDMSAVRSP